MPFSGIVEPEQLTILTVAVEHQCLQAGIDPASPEREEIARLVMALFTNGAATIEELKLALLVHSERDRVLVARRAKPLLATGQRDHASTWRSDAFEP